MCMNFRPKKRIKVKFIIPDFVDLRLGDLKEFLQEHTNKATVRDPQESCYLSEVPPESSEETPRSMPSKRQYNKCARIFIGSQASESSGEDSSKEGDHSKVQNCKASNKMAAYSTYIDLSKYSKVSEISSCEWN